MNILKQKNSVSPVTVWLAVILSVVLTLSFSGLYYIYTLNHDAFQIVNINQQKVALAHTMRDTIRLREISMQKMLRITDVFDRDEELQKFYSLATTYREARSVLLTLPMDEKEKALQERLTNLIRIAQPNNQMAAEMIAYQPDNEKLREFVKVATEQQSALLTLLNELVDMQNIRATRLVQDRYAAFDMAIYMVVLLGLLMLLGFSFILKTSRLISQNNRKLISKNKQLAETTEKANSANELKSSFLANMSHEIRTPLTAIIGFAEELLESDSTRNSRINAANNIIKGGKHLLQIINDILDLSKIEAEKLELESAECSVFDLLNDVAAIMEPMADSKGLSFKVDYEFPLPNLIKTDPLRLKQILINLVSNAIKFTDAGKVLIIVGYQVNNDMLEITVIDSGIGMTEEQIEKVFDVFNQADVSTTRKYGGTGLGLSLSRSLAFKLGGDITVKSEIDMGTKFTLKIRNEKTDYEFLQDYYDVPEQAAIETSTGVNNKYTGKILVAEDDVINQELIYNILKRTGADVDIADNGEIALNKIKQNQYDLVFMDMQMPVMGGEEVARTLRRQGFALPIIALTANAMTEDRASCLANGFTGFLTKPFVRKDIYKMVAQYLSKVANSDVVNETITSTLLDGQPQMERVVYKFYETFPTYKNEINSYLDTDNWSALGAIIHRLKGTSGNMGLEQLMHACLQAEPQIAEQNKDAVVEHMSEIYKIMDIIVAQSNIVSFNK